MVQEDDRGKAPVADDDRPQVPPELVDLRPDAPVPPLVEGGHRHAQELRHLHRSGQRTPHPCYIILRLLQSFSLSPPPNGGRYRTQPRATGKDTTVGAERLPTK